MNSVNITGEILSKTFAIKNQHGEYNLAWFFIGVDRPYLTKKQEKIKDRYFCKCIYQNANFAKNFCKEGMVISVSGHLELFNTKTILENGNEIVAICCDKIEILKNNNDKVEIAKNKSTGRKRKAAAIISENSEEEIGF